MKTYLFKAADFFRLIDETNKISITNIAVWVVLVKIATTQDFNLVDAGALFVTLLNYSGKKLLKKMKEPSEKKEDVSKFEEKLKELQDKLNSIMVTSGIKRTVL